jgi:MOSC domain-containing protein YiiM
MNPEPTSGYIFQINASGGGVPKKGMHDAQVRMLGIYGDRHAHMKIHGGPERALCLYSLERILELQSEGHPVFPGSLGENLTVAGLDWEQVLPNVCMRLGAQVLIQITRFTTPCNTITASFADGNSLRISHEKHPGWSRVYARVLQGGNIQVGDRVTMEKNLDYGERGVL